jgi:hypothetical protein
LRFLPGVVGISFLVTDFTQVLSSKQTRTSLRLLPEAYGQQELTHNIA